MVSSSSSSSSSACSYACCSYDLCSPYSSCHDSDFSDASSSLPQPSYCHVLSSSDCDQPSVVSFGVFIVRFVCLLLLFVFVII